MLCQQIRHFQRDGHSGNVLVAEQFGKVVVRNAADRFGIAAGDGGNGFDGFAFAEAASAAN